MESIKVKDVMFYEPFMIRPGQSVAEAAELMKDIDCGALPVGQPENVVGIITDRDITLRVTAEKKDPATTQVQDAMSKILRSCDEETAIEEATRLMRKFGVSRMVVTKGKRVTGIVTLKHLLQNIGDDKASNKVLNVFLEPEAAPMKIRSRSHG